MEPDKTPHKLGVETSKPEGRGVRRASRRAITALFVGLIAGLVALAIVGPTPSAPAATPVDTFTHVDIHVSNAGFDVTPSTIPAGIVEVTVYDNRANTSKKLVVSSTVSSFTTGTTMVTWRQLGGILFTVVDPGGFIFDRRVNVVMPLLAAPTEPSTRISLDITADSYTAPYRDVRREQPYLPKFAASAPPDDRLWTTVVAGRNQFVLHNASGAQQQCWIDPIMRKQKIAAGATATIGAGLKSTGADGSGTYVVTCEGAGTTRLFDLLAS